MIHNKNTTQSKLTQNTAVRNELLEWLDPATQDKFVTEIAPAVEVCFLPLLLHRLCILPMR